MNTKNTSQFRCSKCKALPFTPCMRPRGVPAKAMHKERSGIYVPTPEVQEEPVVDADGIIHYFMTSAEALLADNDAFGSGSYRARTVMRLTCEVSQPFRASYCSYYLEQRY